MRRRLALFLFLITQLSHAIETGRSEVERYHILTDRKTTDKFLLGADKQYLWLDLGISSKLTQLLGEVSNTESATNEASQTVQVTELLSSELNTEKYFNLDVDVNIPLIPFSYKNFKLFPSVFYEFHVGTSFSIDNNDNALVPTVSLYAANHIHYGVQTLFKTESIRDGLFKIRLYKSSIKDLQLTKNSTQIASDDSIIDLNDFDKSESTYKMDLSFFKDKSTYSYLLEIQDLKFMESKKSEKESYYGFTPLIHMAYQKKFVLGEYIQAKSTFGVAHRNRYDFSKSLYTALSLDFKERYPLRIQTKLDSDFISLWAGTVFKHLHFHYGLRMPYKNPQNNLWVATIHRISLGIPF